jgi:hypothetical protein
MPPNPRPSMRRHSRRRGGPDQARPPIGCGPCPRECAGARPFAGPGRPRQAWAGGALGGKLVSGLPGKRTRSSQRCRRWALNYRSRLNAAAAVRRGVGAHHDHVWVVDRISNSLWGWFGFAGNFAGCSTEGHVHETHLHNPALRAGIILLLVDVLIVFVFSFPANSGGSYVSRPFPRDKRATGARA